MAALPLAAIYTIIVIIKDAPVLGASIGDVRILLDGIVSEIVLGVLLAAGVAAVEVRVSTQRARIAGYVIVVVVAMIANQAMWEGMMASLGLLGGYKWPWWVRFWGNGGGMLVQSLFAIALYGMWRRARERAAALRDMQRRRVELLRQTTHADLLAMQARIDPTFLLETLQAIDRAYDAGRAGGRRLIDALIDYLRAVLPGVDSATSTLGKECDLARAYLDLARERFALDLRVETDLPSASRQVPFPPMLVLPIVDDVVKSLRTLGRPGRVTLRRVAADAGMTLAIEVEPACMPSANTLALVRKRLAELSGGTVTLRDSTILVEVLHAQSTSTDR